MAIDSTLILKEVEQIVAQGQGLSHYQLTLQVLAGEEWLTPIKLNLYSLSRDYEEGFGDTVVVEALFGLGTYVYRLRPHRDHLRVQLTVTPLYENSTAMRSDVPRRTRRLRAVLMEQDDPALRGDNPQVSDEEQLNVTGLKAVQLQLLDDALHQVRMTTIGRLYRAMTPMDVLRGVLTETTRLVDTNHQQQIFGVDVVPGFNPTPRQHLILPHGTPLTQVADYLQHEEGGLYPTGVGCYLQQGQWYVFPLYNVERVNRAPTTLTVLNVPPQRYMGAERTYRVTERQVIVIAAGTQTQTTDEGLYQQLNDGNAMRFTDARRLLGGFGETARNRVQVSRRDNLFEFQGPELDGGLTHARWAGDRATSNPMQHYSRLARRNGRYLLVEWDHGDASLLTPGMPVKYLSAINNQLKTYHGVLLGVHEHRAAVDPGGVVTRYPAKVQLKLFLVRVDSS